MFRERQQILICAAALAMICGFVLFRYLPLQRKLKAVEQKKGERKFVVSEGMVQREQLTMLKEQLKELQNAVGSYESNIPAQRALGDFLHEIADLMNGHKLKEQEITPGKEIKVHECNCIPLSMQGKGKLTQIFEFFKRLQSLDRLVRIEMVKLDNDSDFSGEVSMRTRAAVYYRPGEN